MQNKIVLFILLLTGIFQQEAYTQEALDTIPQNSLWPNRSPQTLEQGRKVWQLFGPKKMGAAKNMEWQIQPLFFFISPNLGLKKRWTNDNKRISIATVHKINYPSIYLNLFAREGAGGVLPKDSEIPPMISLRNEILIGINSEKTILTLRGGIATAFKLGSAEKNFPDIDFPFLYNRTLAFNNTPNIYMGINIHQDIRPKLNLEADFTAFKVSNENNNFVYESKLIFFWKKSDKFGLKAGAATAFGQYPYGKDFQIIPVFDIVFGWGKNKSLSKAK